MGLFKKATRNYELNLPVGPFSNVYYVDSVNGNDNHNGKNPEQPMATILAAYNKCTANQHDVVVLTGSGGHNLTASLTWSKNYTHLVGMCAPVRTAQRARIFAAADIATTPILEISATGCIFKNFYIFNGSAVNTALGNVQLTGGRCYFENVHFAGPGHAAVAITGGYALGISGADGEHLFKDCVIGITTIGSGDGFYSLALGPGYPPRLVFEECTFLINATHQDAALIGCNGNLGNTAWGVDYHLYRNCLFFNTGATTIQAVFEFEAAPTPAQQFIFMINPQRNDKIDSIDDSAGACVWIGDAQDMGTATSMGDMIVGTA